MDDVITTAALHLIYNDNTLDAWPDPLAKEQVSLRVAHGGLGLVPLHHLHRAAHLAAIGGFMAGRELTPHPVRQLLAAHVASPPAGLADLVHAFHGEYSTSIAPGHDLLPDSVPALVKYTRGRAHAQHDLTAPLNAARHKSFLSHLNALVKHDAGKRDLVYTRRKAQYLSASAPGASTWLLTLPSHHTLKIDNHAFTVALNLRFGIDAPFVIPAELVGKHCCQRDGAADDKADGGAPAADGEAGGASDTDADEEPRPARPGPLLTVAHAVTCRSGFRVGPTQRHNDLVETIALGLHAAGLQTHLEPRFGLHNSTRGPDLLVNMPAGRPVVLDLTVRSPVAEHAVIKAAAEPLHAIALAEKEKGRLYQADCDAARTKLMIYGIEPTGAVGRQTRVFNAMLRDQLAQSGRAPYFPATYATRSFVTFLQQQLAVCLLRNNSLIVAASVRAGQRRLAARRDCLPGNA
jgi:hypothetical protein